jgi:hypothetical protein
VSLEFIEFDAPDGRLGEGIQGEDYELGERLSQEELNEDELNEEYQWAN